MYFYDHQIFQDSPNIVAMFYRNDISVIALEMRISEFC